MKYPYKQHKLFCALLCLLLFLINGFPLVATEKKVIRVGYPTMNGLSMKDKDGNYYGYDYDYLMQIAQYTGWEYEFVEVKGDANERITKLMQMLKDGEIDLMGETKYLDALTKDYDYASEPYGNAYNIIAVPDDSELLDMNSLLNKKDLKIGVLKSASKRAPLLTQYAETNGFEYTSITCENVEDLMAKIERKEIDAFLYVDLSLPNNFHSIARFSPDPFFFITTKGNSQIISDLNKALTTINSINPTLPSTLYNRYFGNETETFILNDNEKEFLRKKQKINVLVQNGFAPIQYNEHGVARGVGKDILTNLGKKTGVKFHYIYAKNFNEYKKIANNGEADILITLPYGSKIANTMNVTLTAPFLSSNLTLLTHKKVNPTHLNTLKQGTTLYNNELYDTNENLSYYETSEEVLKALNEHKIDYAYVNNYSYTYYMNKYQFKNISSFSAPDYLRSQYAFGVFKSKDLTLVGILNKAIRTQSNAIDTYIYKNAYVESGFILSTFLMDHILLLVFIALFIIILILYFVHAYYKKQLRMKKAVELEYKRYQMLSDISGEMTFSYDYTHDYLKVSTSGINKITRNEYIQKFSKLTCELEEYSEILQVIHQYILEEKDISCEKETRLLTGDTRWYQISIKIIADIEKNKETAVYAVGKVIDIQQEKAEKEELRIKSETDILTGILNRGAAEQEIGIALHQEQGLGALIMIDLDNFKTVNDDYGHIEGDKVLVETATILTSLFQNQIVARLGGDEFVVYVHDTDTDRLQELCEDTLEKFQNLDAMKNKNMKLSVSMGAVYSSYSHDFMELLKHADENLYQVKRSGRNNFLIS